MTDINTGSVSSSSDPYSVQSYSTASNDKNTLSITSYFKLLAAEMANQDMSNPMDSSEIMNQMSQMAMVQSLASMTTALQTSTSLSKTSYAASMIGKEVTLNVASTEVDEETGAAKMVTGIIESVNISGEEPTFKLEGDNTWYSMDQIASISKGVVNATTTTATTTTTDTAALAGKAKIIAELAKLNVYGDESMTFQELTDLYENAKDGKMPHDRNLWIDKSGYDDFDWSVWDEEEEEEEESTSTVSAATTTTTETATLESTETIDQEAAAASSTEAVEEVAEAQNEESSESVEAVEETSEAAESTSGEE